THFIFYGGILLKSLCSLDKVILINENKTWVEALYYCREHHHDLVYISNLDEQRWVQDRAKKANSPYVWLGLRYTCTLGFWFWVSDNVVSYENWAPNGKLDECDMSGAMDSGGQHDWTSKQENMRFNFICSKDKVILINESKIWEQALNYCREHHHDLRAKKANSNYVWMGLRYTCALEMWFWTENCDMSVAVDRGWYKWFSRPENERFNFISAI
uniref:C-type lectin domain-containing protein n=1 Tax=Monopterus albus TaxID=43700 RepID=A0A3Q3RAX2_MONAL